MLSLSVILKEAREEQDELTNLFKYLLIFKKDLNILLKLFMIIKFLTCDFNSKQ